MTRTGRTTTAVCNLRSLGNAAVNFEHRPAHCSSTAAMLGAPRPRSRPVARHFIPPRRARSRQPATRRADTRPDARCRALSPDTTAWAAPPALASLGLLFPARPLLPPSGRLPEDHYRYVAVIRIVIGSYSDPCYPAAGPAPPDAPMPEPRPRSPAQIEASRRNGARSKGPVTAEGKARASRNALEARPHRHAPPGARGRGARRAGGADRPPDRRGRRRVRDRGPAGAAAGHRVLEGRAGRADRGRPVRRRPQAPPAAARLRSGSRPTRSPPSTSSASTPSAASRPSIGREISRCLKELRQLRKDALAEGTDEPTACGKTNPEPAPPANDDATIAANRP